MQVLVARIGRPHGLKGEVTVEVHTDRPLERFVVGARFAARPAAALPTELTVRSVRVHKGITLLGFEEAGDRTAAEALRGTRLFVERDEPAEIDPHESGGPGGAVDPDHSGDSVEDGWYEDELVGLAVFTVSGRRAGEVTGLLTRPVQDLLVVRLETGQEALVPFVDAIVPHVDLEAGRVVIDPPPGLLDLAGE